MPQLDISSFLGLPYHKLNNQTMMERNGPNVEKRWVILIILSYFPSTYRQVIECEKSLGNILQGCRGSEISIPIPTPYLQDFPWDSHGKIIIPIPIPYPHILRYDTVSTLLKPHCCMYVCLSGLYYFNGWEGSVNSSLLVVILISKQLTWGNRVRWFQIWYCKQHIVNMYCCLCT